MKLQAKTFNLSDLINKTIEIKSFKDKNIELIVGKDQKTGCVYILKEIEHPYNNKG